MATALLLGLLAACWFISPLPLSAQEVNGPGSTSTNFQKIGMGARAVGMGESFISVADDSTASFWNPAGLILAKGTQFSLTHGEWLIGVTHEFFAFSQNIDRDGAFGGSVGYLGTGSFPGALEDPSGNYGGVGGNISAAGYIGSLAYAQRLGNWFNGNFWRKSMLGIRATVVGQDVVNVGSAGVAFDLGYLYEVTKKQFYLAAVLQNLGTNIQNFSQPLEYKIGGSYRFYNLLMKKDRNLLSLDLDGYNDTGIKFNLGDEYRLAFGRNAVFLRLGYRTGSDLGGLAGLTSGVGVSHRFDDFDAALDYAFVPYGVLGMTHRISLSVAIGGKVDVPEAYTAAPPAFTLAQQSLPISLATKSEEPLSDWKITLVDANKMLVKTFEGKGNPPGRFIWDGKNQAGDLVPQGNYTYTLSVTNDEDTSSTSKPHDVYAKWVPKKVPYQYSFNVPGDLLFDSAKAELLQKGYETVRKAAEAIQARYPDSQIIVAGHTDNQQLAKTAKFKNNQELSVARAQAVVNYLVANGMSAGRLSAMGYGDTKPIASNSTPEGRAKNRRVELVISGVMEATATDLISEGMIMYNQKNYREALDRFLKALESDVRNSRAYQLAGNCYMILGAKPQAIQAYQKAYKFDPNNLDLKKWLETYAPASQPAPPPAVPANQAQPTPQPAASNEAAPPAQPQSAAPPKSPAQAAPATGMPMPVEAN